MGVDVVRSLATPHLYGDLSVSTQGLHVLYLPGLESAIEDVASCLGKVRGLGNEIVEHIEEGASRRRGS